MNTDELKKLAEAMQLTSPQLANMSFDSFAEADKLRSRFRLEAPAAILELLQINAELVESLTSLTKMAENFPNELHQKHPDVIEARTILAKAEGGEL